MSIALRISPWPHFGSLLKAFPQNGPVPNSFWMGEGYIEARSTERGVCLNSVFVNPSHRGRGLGSRYMKQFLAIIDQHGGEVFVAVEPFGLHNGLTEGQLRMWYSRLGFQLRGKDRDPNYMWRPMQRIKVSA